MPAWQKRQPSVQPRATSTAMRSKMASPNGNGESSGNGKRLMSATHTRLGRAGTRGSDGASTTRNPVSGSRFVAYNSGTYRGNSAARRISRSRRGTPSLRMAANASTNAGKASSASPMKKASMNGASGSGWVAVGPPHSTSGLVSSRSSARSGSPARSRMFSTLVYVSSYCNDMPSTSNCRSGVADSSVTNGNPRARISPSQSTHGAKARSHAIRGCLFRMP